MEALSHRATQVRQAICHSISFAVNMNDATRDETMKQLRNLPYQVPASGMTNYLVTMGGNLRKVKLAIGCVNLPETTDDDHSAANVSDHRRTTTTTTTLSSSSSKSKSKCISSSSSSFSKVTCAICLDTVILGNGNAIFTAECSHSFHFQCIASNVKHGNKICPICRAKWKQVPFQSPTSNVTRLPTLPQVGTVNENSLLHNITEPSIFDDDEEVVVQQAPITHIIEDASNIKSKIEIETYLEVSSVPNSYYYDNFNVLIHLKAPPHPGNQLQRNSDKKSIESSANNSSAPVDLVTVLDISASMEGSKIELLKQAMSFVIENLTESDRLCVIVFNSTSHRIFPLRLMNDSGRAQALHVVNSLVPEGGTDIGEGLKKGVKVFVDRRWKNPVSSIMLLSDGQNNYHTGSRSILPGTIRRDNCECLHIPVHTFGFGADHDATLMHSISEMSGGTFSFIEAENVIQDAFAQCIGGLLSVVVQELKVEVECVNPCLQLSSVKAGSYQSSLTSNRRMASIKVGDLYAEEERDFLVSLNIPVDKSSDKMSLLMVKGLYSDPITKTTGLNVTSEVKIQRPDVATDVVVVVSREVDRQRNRLDAAEAMAEAKVKAERGELAAAISVLDTCHKAISETISAGDPLCVALLAELKEMQERMVNRRVYEESGRAYILSGLSSHSGQRATARGDSTQITSFLHAYTTTSMVDMLTLSQTQILSKKPSLTENLGIRQKKK